MALTGAKPFLKNISKEIHSKALADNTQTILSLKTERNTCGKNTNCECKRHGRSPSIPASRVQPDASASPRRRVETRARPPWSSFVRHRTEQDINNDRRARRSRLGAFCSQTSRDQQRPPGKTDPSCWTVLDDDEACSPTCLLLELLQNKSDSFRVP